MLVNKIRLAIIVASIACGACGPEVKEKSDWMFDVFSSPGPGNRDIGLVAVSHYEFRDDGELAVGGVSECSKNVEATPEIFKWTRDGDDVVVVELPEANAFDEWRVTKGTECGLVRLDQMQNEQATVSFDLTRGPVCMRALPACPEGTSCETCETVWCDDEAPSCG